LSLAISSSGEAAIAVAEPTPSPTIMRTATLRDCKAFLLDEDGIGKALD
jgi:hypothetical protein